MLRVFTNDHYVSFSLNDLAFFTYFLYAGFDLHLLHRSFLYAYNYFVRQVIRPFVRSYTETSTVTLSPGTIQI